MVPLDSLALCLQDDDKRGYLVHALTALNGGAVAPDRLFELHEGLPGRVIREGRPAIVTDLMKPDESLLELEGVLGAAGLTSALIVPVRGGGGLRSAAPAVRGGKAGDVGHPAARRPRGAGQHGAGGDAVRRARGAGRDPARHHGKIEAGIDAVREEADFAALIHEAVRIVSPTAEANGVTLSVQAPPEAETLPRVPSR